MAYNWALSFRMVDSLSSLCDYRNPPVECSEFYTQNRIDMRTLEKNFTPADMTCSNLKLETEDYVYFRCTCISNALIEIHCTREIKVQ